MSSRKVARRDFLKTSSAAAVGLSAVAFSPGSLFAAPSSENDFAPLLGVGYAQSAPEAGQSVRLAPADRALVGDPSFISRSARVTIHTFARAASREGKPGGAAIDVIHPAIGYAPDKYPRFRAWTYATDKNSVDNVGGAIAFTVPVTATQGLQFAIRRVPVESNGPAKEIPLALTLSSESGAFKLQRGIYVIAFREENRDSVPSWSTLSVSSKGGQYLVDTKAFSHAILTIDYAS